MCVSGFRRCFVAPFVNALGSLKIEIESDSRRGAEARKTWMQASAGSCGGFPLK
jgi:hypothetical protein